MELASRTLRGNFSDFYRSQLVHLIKINMWISFNYDLPLQDLDLYRIFLFMFADRFHYVVLCSSAIEMFLFNSTNELKWLAGIAWLVNTLGTGSNNALHFENLHFDLLAMHLICTLPVGNVVNDRFFYKYMGDEKLKASELSTPWNEFASDSFEPCSLRRHSFHIAIQWI